MASTNLIDVYKEHNQKINQDYNLLLNTLTGANNGIPFLKNAQTDEKGYNRYTFNEAMRQITQQPANPAEVQSKLTSIKADLKQSILSLNQQLRSFGDSISGNTTEASLVKIAKIMSYSYYSKLLVIVFIYVQQMLITFQCSASQVQQQETAQLAAQKNAERDRAVAAKHEELQKMQATLEAQIKSLQDQTASRNSTISTLKQQLETLRTSQSETSLQTQELLKAEQDRANDLQRQLSAEQQKTAAKEAENAQLRELLKEAIPIMASFSLDGL